MLALSGPATVRQVGEAWTRLTEAAAAHRDVTLDLSDVSACDLSFVQLIESARKTWAAAGGSIRLQTAANPVLRDVLERGGFLGHEDPARLEFWTLTGAAS